MIVKTESKSDLKNKSYVVWMQFNYNERPNQFKTILFTQFEVKILQV